MMTSQPIKQIKCSEGKFVQELGKYGDVLSLMEVYRKNSPPRTIVVGVVKHVYSFVSDENGKLLKLILRECDKNGKKGKYFFGFVFHNIAAQLNEQGVKEGDLIGFRCTYIEPYTRLDIHRRFHKLQAILGSHDKDGERIFLNKSVKHTEIAKSSHVRTTSGKYQYSKISELTIGKGFNLYGVVKSVLKKPTSKERHIIVSVVDETCVGNEDFLVHIYFKNESRCPKPKVNYIIRFHRMKVENFQNKLDGRVFHSFDIVVFPPVGTSNKSASCCAQSYHFDASDVARLKELRTWIASGQEEEQEDQQSLESQEVEATLLKDIKKDGTYKIECKVVKKKLSQDVLLLTVVDGSLESDMKITVTNAPMQLKQLKVGNLVALENVQAEVRDSHPSICLKMSGPDCCCELIRGTDPRSIQLKRRIQAMKEMVKDIPLNSAEELLLEITTQSDEQEVNNCTDSEMFQFTLPEPARNDSTIPKKNKELKYKLSPSGKLCSLKSKREYVNLMNHIHKKVVKTHCLPSDTRQTSEFIQKRNSLDEQLLSHKNSTGKTVLDSLQSIHEQDENLQPDENSSSMILPEVQERTENVVQDNFRIQSAVNEQSKFIHDNTRHQEIDDTYTSDPMEHVEQIQITCPLQSHEEPSRRLEQNNLRIQSAVDELNKLIHDLRPQERDHTYNSHPMQHLEQIQGTCPLQSHEETSRRVEQARAEFLRTVCQEKRVEEYEKQRKHQHVGRCVDLPPISDFSDNPTDVDVQSYVKKFINQNDKSISEELSAECYSDFSVKIRSKRKTQIVTSTQLSDSESAVPSSCVDENDHVQRVSSFSRVCPQNVAVEMHQPLMNNADVTENPKFNQVNNKSSESGKSDPGDYPGNRVNIKSKETECTSVAELSDCESIVNASCVDENEHPQRFGALSRVQKSGAGVELYSNDDMSENPESNQVNIKLRQTEDSDVSSIENLSGTEECRVWTSDMEIDTVIDTNFVENTENVCGMLERNYDEVDRRFSKNAKSKKYVQCYMDAENCVLEADAQGSLHNEASSNCNESRLYSSDIGRNYDEMNRRFSKSVKSKQCVQSYMDAESCVLETDAQESLRNMVSSHCSKSCQYSLSDIGRKKCDDSRRSNMLRQVSIQADTQESFHNVAPSHCNKSCQYSLSDIGRKEFDDSKRCNMLQHVSVQTDTQESLCNVASYHCNKSCQYSLSDIGRKEFDDSRRCNLLRHVSVQTDFTVLFLEDTNFIDHEMEDIHALRTVDVQRENAGRNVACVDCADDEPEKAESLLQSNFVSDADEDDSIFASGIVRAEGTRHYCLRHVNDHIDENCIVKGWVYKIEPPLYDRFPENDIVSGVCYKCTKVCSFQALQHYNTKTHTVLCSVCLQKGIRSKMELKFLLLLHLLDEDDNKIIVSASSGCAAQLLGCTALSYVDDEHIYCRVNNMLNRLVLPSCELPVEQRGPKLRLLVTPSISSEGTLVLIVHSTYLYPS